MGLNKDAVQTKWLPDLLATLPNVDGKVYVITGTTSGTGLVAARVVGNLGGTVLLLNRPSQRVEAMMATLKQQSPNGTFIQVDCDLQDFDSVRAAAAKIKEDFTAIDCIANNAGVMAMGDIATKDGYDIQMQTNHLSHFLLVKELFPLLQQAAIEHGEARVVNHSSGARLLGSAKAGLSQEYLGRNGGNLGGTGTTWYWFGGPNFERYFHSKLANSVFTHAMERRCMSSPSSSKVQSFTCHPGGSATNLGDHLLGPISNYILGWIGPLVFQSQEDAAMGLIRCMVDPTVQRGQLYGPKNNSMKGPAVLVREFKTETDLKSQDMLWRMSEAAVGEFAIPKSSL